MAELMKSAGEGRRLRVLYLMPNMMIGGPQRQLLYLASALDRQKVEPLLAVLHRAKERETFEYSEAFESVFHLEVPAQGTFGVGRLPWMPLAAWRLWRLLRRLRPDVVHAWLPVPSVVASLVARAAGVPLFVVGRRSLAALPRRGSRLLTWVDRWPLHRAGMVLANCEAIARELVERDGLEPGRVRVVRNALDARSFHPGQEPELREQLGFEAGNVVFGVVANFFPCKRHEDFLEAARQIHATRPESRFLMLGVDCGTLPKVRRQLHEAGLEAVTRLLPGVRAVEAWYRAMDVYLCCSESEGLPNSVLEAMASGLAVISTGVGGVPEMIRPGESGLLVGARRPAEVAELGRLLCVDAGLRRQLGERARKAVEECYAPSAVARAHEDLYRTALVVAESGQGRLAAPWPEAAGRGAGDRI